MKGAKRHHQEIEFFCSIWELLWEFCSIWVPNSLRVWIFYEYPFLFNLELIQLRECHIQSFFLYSISCNFMPVFEDIIVFSNIFVSVRYFQNACYHTERAILC